MFSLLHSGRTPWNFQGQEAIRRVGIELGRLQENGIHPMCKLSSPSFPSKQKKTKGSVWDCSI